MAIICNDSVSSEQTRTVVANVSVTSDEILALGLSEEGWYTLLAEPSWRIGQRFVADLEEAVAREPQPVAP